MDSSKSIKCLTKRLALLTLIASTTAPSAVCDDEFRALLKAVPETDIIVFRTPTAPTDHRSQPTRAGNFPSGAAEFVNDSSAEFKRLLQQHSFIRDDNSDQENAVQTPSHENPLLDRTLVDSTPVKTATDEPTPQTIPPASIIQQVPPTQSRLVATLPVVERDANLPTESALTEIPTGVVIQDRLSSINQATTRTIAKLSEQRSRRSAAFQGFAMLPDGLLEESALSDDSVNDHPATAQSRQQSVVRRKPANSGAVVNESQRLQKASRQALAQAKARLQGGAVHSAKKFAIESLTLAVDSADTATQTHNRAIDLQVGLEALREVKDFAQPGIEKMADAVTKLVNVHATTALKDADLSKVTPHAAMRAYLALAKTRIEAATKGSPLAAQSLMLLGKIERQAAPTGSPLSDATVLALHGAAANAVPDDGNAVDQLIDTLMSQGLSKQAIPWLRRRSVANPTRQQYEKLLEASQQSGDIDLARKTLAKLIDQQSPTRLAINAITPPQSLDTRFFDAETLDVVGSLHTKSLLPVQPSAQADTPQPTIGSPEIQIASQAESVIGSQVQREPEPNAPVAAKDPVKNDPAETKRSRFTIRNWFSRLRR